MTQVWDKESLAGIQSMTSQTAYAIILKRDWFHFTLKILLALIVNMV